MKTINILLLSTFAFLLLFTACSEEEVMPTEQSQMEMQEVSIEEIDPAMGEYVIVDPNNIEFTLQDKMASKNQYAFSSSTCTVIICATVGPNSTYIIENIMGENFTLQGATQFCIEIPISEGAQRDVYYFGTGGVTVQVYENNSNPIPCTPWDVEPTNPALPPVCASTTLTLSCNPCG